MSGLTISRADEMAGVGIETVRFYERRGLIEQPLKPRNVGYRHYSTVVVRRIRFIWQAQDIGFSLRETQGLLFLGCAPTADCADVRKCAANKVREV